MFKLVGRVGVALQQIRRSTRQIGSVQVPFGDDLEAVKDEDLNLQDFQHYRGPVPFGAVKDGPEVASGVEEGREGVSDDFLGKNRLSEVVSLREPVILVSKLKDPYMNLAIEDYVYNKMPLDEVGAQQRYKRLLFYINYGCVVVGKNQNPWKEVNIPLLTSLQIPLVRRFSGGGTVVHDLGNVNYSFMTKKGQFDRFKFSTLITQALNRSDEPKYKLEVNERGDITTTTQQDGANYKLSGSAYKISKGKSYHHGTMLLDLRLDILGKLLSRDESKIGLVDSQASIDSVKSKVTNLELSSDRFVELVSAEFEREFGTTDRAPESNQELKYELDSEYDQDELFNLKDFTHMGMDLPRARTFVIDETTLLDPDILKTCQKLQDWSWKFGNTPKFTHGLKNHKFGFSVKFHVDKGAIMNKFDLNFHHDTSTETRQMVLESFACLDEITKRKGLEYKGSNVAGFITNDDISDWIGMSIDGTI